jgi:Fe(3+) dicitrate transport protein
MTINKNSLILIICLLCPSFMINAQEGRGSVKGSILDKEGLPIPYANVAIEGTSMGTITNLEGNFLLENLKPKDYILKLTSVGFIEIRQTITINSNEQLSLAFTFQENVFEVPQVTIIATRDRLFTKIPGSVGFVSQRELKLLNPISGNEAFRRIAGVHVVEEEGAGLRTNIGIRGLDPDRSRNVLILEDGIPVALNPYGEPDSYYTPQIDRMQGVEVLKGSGQILYGPRTIGGVVNYITANPPADEQLRIKMQGGENGYFSSLLGYGNTFGNAGVQINYLRKQADDLGMSEFRINDLTGKMLFSLSEASKIAVKFGIYRETSNSTYVGITQSIFDEGEQDFLRIAPDDRLNLERNSFSITHDYRINPNLNLQTQAYAYNTTRNWRRQDFSYNPNASNQTGVIWGDTSIPGGAIYMRNGTGNRNRRFEVAGFEQRINYSFNLGSLENELTAGYRYLYEKGYEQRINGSFPTAESGELVTDEDRTGNAFSTFVQNKTKINDKLTIDLGLRAEFYGFEREVFRNSFSGVVRDTSLVNNSSVSQIIPGLGFNYKINPNFNLFGGLHRGFAPPRVKDAINAVGVVLQLEAEKSWNYELGFRTVITKGLYTEFTGFILDFSNQIIPISESSGGAGTGLINGGETTHKGLETSINFDLSEVKSVKYNLMVDVSATYQKAEFNGDRFQNIQGELRNISGNRTPYAPQLLLSSAITIESPFGLSARITNTFVGDQFTDPANTTLPSANGRIGKISEYLLTDLVLIYQLPKVEQLRFNATVKNLTDQRFIASRRPEGIRVGLPRFVSLGIDWTL